MQRTICCTLGFAMASMSLQAQECDIFGYPLYATYQTESTSEGIASVRTLVDGDFRKLPVIDLSAHQQIELSFDYLWCDNMQEMAYRVIHCDADWKADGLSVMDYLEGFMPARVPTIKPSFNTFVNYNHYSVTLPNQDVRMKASGNYAVVFFPWGESEPQDLAICCFSVSEQMLFVKGTVSVNTDIDLCATHQQVNMDFSWSNAKLPFLNPAQELKVRVMQDHQYSTVRCIQAPLSFGGNQAHYEHDKNLIFDAGNHWRRFDIPNLKYPSVHVDRLQYDHENGYYVVSLEVDRTRAGKQYRYDQDQNGRFLINATQVTDKEIEADYCNVVFCVDGVTEAQVSDLRLVGDLTQSVTPVFEYIGEGRAITSCLLKQGAYNYRYNLSTIEGDYYETQHEYDVYVYYRPFGSRYDRLLSVSTIK